MSSELLNFWPERDSMPIVAETDDLHDLAAPRITYFIGSTS